jgi:hypothetical protein
VTGNQPASTGNPDPTTETPGTTTSEPQEEPPTIVEYKLSPEEIKVSGPIKVTVTAAHAHGVHMVLDSGETGDLALVEGNEFDGSFDVLPGDDNGDYHVHLTPWRDAEVGVEVLAPYKVSLPKPGTPVFWETSDELGPGQVAALGVLPDGQVVEFGTHFPNGLPRCYLRRRDKKGVVNATEFVLKDSDCTAIDLQVDDQGAMFVLVNRKGGDGLRWWHGQTAAWGLGVTNISTGELGQTAVALARHSSGLVAVCGYTPTAATDVDAMVKLFEPNTNVSSQFAFDYQPVDKPAHSFSELSRDCIFAGDTLVLVGEVRGPHGIEVVKRDRLSILRMNNKGKNAEWAVAGPQVKTQSGAQAVAVDDMGRLVVAGYTCDDVCQPEGDLGIYDSDNTLEWKVSLGAFPIKDVATKDLAWSPAGYAVVATGGLKGAESLFTVRAFGQSQVVPLWTFTHKDINQLSLAFGLAVGGYGEVYAGGVAEDGFPAVAYIGG